MLSTKAKAELLNDAIDRLDDADCLQQKALTGDLCFDIHTRIESLIADILSEIHALADNQGK